MQQTESRQALSFLETALLWSMRAWTVGHNRKLDVSPQIRLLYERFGTPDASRHLDNFMSALSKGAKRHVNIDCVCFLGVSPDESLLLDILALQQEGYPDDARTLLVLFAAPDAAAEACDNAAALVLLLNANGHHLTRAPAALRRHAFLHRTASQNLKNFSTALN